MLYLESKDSRDEQQGCKAIRVQKKLGATVTALRFRSSALEVSELPAIREPARQFPKRIYQHCSGETS